MYRWISQGNIRLICSTRSRENLSLKVVFVSVHSIIRHIVCWRLCAWFSNTVQQHTAWFPGQLIYESFMCLLARLLSVKRVKDQ